MKFFTTIIIKVQLREQTRVQILKKDLSDLFETAIADFPLHSTVFLDISLYVKVEKQDEEHCPMKQYDIAVLFGEITLNEDGECGMDKESGKLHQLHCSQISETINIRKSEENRQKS